MRCFLNVLIQVIRSDLLLLRLDGCFYTERIALDHKMREKERYLVEGSWIE